jgi:hypothetical protein
MLFQYDVMHPLTILRVSRILLLVRFAVKAPPALIDLISSMDSFQKGWTAAVLGDLKWLCQCEKFSNCRQYSFAEWVSFSKTYAKFMKTHVKKFAYTRYANIDTRTHSTNKHPSIYNNIEHKCDACNFTAPTFQQLSLHAFKKHGIKSIWKTYVGSANFCRICLKMFSNSECVVNHLKKKTKICRQTALLRGPVCTMDESNAYDREQAEHYSSLAREGKRRHSVKFPVKQMHGPLLPILLDDSTKPSQHHFLGKGHNYYV